MVLQDGTQQYFDAQATPLSRNLHSYDCPVCARSFSGKNRRQHYENHIFTHTGEKPFACPHCSYRSSRKDSLLVHIRKKHTEFENSNSEVFNSIMPENQVYKFWINFSFFMICQFVIYNFYLKAFDYLRYSNSITKYVKCKVKLAHQNWMK